MWGETCDQYWRTSFDVVIFFLVCWPCLRLHRHEGLVQEVRMMPDLEAYGQAIRRETMILFLSSLKKAVENEV